MKSYSEKLKDPRWQRKRLEILQRDQFKCRMCDNTKAQLHVHHRTYEKGLDPWDYEDDMLITFCEDCHETVTTIGKALTFAASFPDNMGLLDKAYLFTLGKHNEYSELVGEILKLLTYDTTMIRPIYDLLYHHNRSVSLAEIEGEKDKQDGVPVLPESETVTTT